MADIRDLMNAGGGAAPPGGGAPNPQMQTPGGMVPKPPVPGAAGQGGMIGNLMKTQPGEGMKKLAVTIAAIARTMIELTLPIFGSHTEEGSDALKAIHALGKMTKGVQIGDMASMLQSLNAMLPPGMKPNAQGDMAQMLAQLTKGGQGAGAMPPGGGAPPSPAGAPPPQIPAAKPMM